VCQATAAGVAACTALGCACRRALKLLYNDSSLSINKHMIAIAILARGDVITIGIALHIYYLIAGLAVENDCRGKILSRRQIVGCGSPGAADGGQRCKYKNG
jgi:hypothetical protein